MIFWTRKYGIWNPTERLSLIVVTDEANSARPTEVLPWSDVGLTDYQKILNRAIFIFIPEHSPIMLIETWTKLLTFCRQYFPILIAFS